MIALSPAQYDLIGGALAFALTVALLSYLIGDNPLYRLALHLFIGVAVGYAVLVVIFQVLLPRLIRPLLSGEPLVTLLAAVPLLVFVFLILKLSPRTSALGNLAIAYMIGVGTAVSIGGAVTGTLVPQIRSTWISLAPAGGLAFLSNAIIAVGTVTTLIVFQFWLRGRSPAGDAQRTPIMQAAAYIGQAFLAITLGAIYGGMILSGIAIFSDRLLALSNWASRLLP